MWSELMISNDDKMIQLKSKRRSSSFQMKWSLCMFAKPDFEAMTRVGFGNIDPKLMAMRYRVCSSNPTMPRRPKSCPAGRVRRSRPVSRAESEAGGSTLSLNTTLTDTTLDLDVRDYTDDYDFDYDETPEHKLARYTSKSQKKYHRACAEMRVTPATYFSNKLCSESLVMRNHILGPKGARACALALTENEEVEELDLSGNAIGPVGAEYFAEMLEENFFIKELRLAENNLGSTGAKLIADALLLNTSVKVLDLSGNGFSEFDAEYFRRLLLANTAIQQLHLSHNCFREIGGVVFGDIIGKNKTLTSLDLSWNHLRRNGAAAIGRGLGSNKRLIYLNVSWNGFYLEGCRTIAKALERNRTLIDLNLQSNRISKECLEELMKGLRKNTILKSLKLSDNPITTDGSMALLAVLHEAPKMALSDIDLGDQCVERQFLEQLHEIQLELTRSLKIKYGVVLKDDQDTNNKPEEDLLAEDPILVLMEFMKLKNLRLIDLFQTLDSDGSHSLSNQEIKTGLLGVGMPLSEKSLNRLLAKLDADKSGDIDFGELMIGQRSHRRKMSTIIEVTKEREMAGQESEIQRVRAKLKELINKKDQIMMQKILEKKGASVSGGARKYLVSSRKAVRPKSSVEPSMATVPE